MSAQGEHVARRDQRASCRPGALTRRPRVPTRRPPHHTSKLLWNSLRVGLDSHEAEFPMKKTNFDRYLESQLEDPAFAARFKQAGEAWDVALQIAALRQRAGLSQKDLAHKLKTSQQQISRLESPSYEGHSLSMLRRVARVLHARVRVVLEPDIAGKAQALAEDPVPYRIKRPADKPA